MKKVYKVGQLSDAHIGYSSGQKTDNQGVNLRVLDGYKALNEATDSMVAEGIDICIVSGDMFHMAHPDIRTIIEAQEALRKLANANIEVYCIAGNHDATDIRSEIPASGALNEPNSKIHSYTEPYVVKEVFPNVFVHFVSHHAFTDQDETMNSIKLMDNAMNILVSHGSCFDTNMNMILHCPQEPREVVIPEFIMDLPWDYTWLGHIHERGWIGSKDGLTDTLKRKQFYGGSLIRRGFSDRPCKLERGWTLWSIDTESEEITPKFFNVTQRPQIDCPKVDATKKSSNEVEELLLNQLKNIYKKYADKDGNIPYETTPIVRQTVTGLTPVTYSAINWSQMSKYSKHFLTYTLKRVDGVVSLDDEDNLSTEKSKKDILEAFDDWVNDDFSEKDNLEDKDEVIDKSKALLKKGQDSVLDDEKK